MTQVAASPTEQGAPDRWRAFAAISVAVFISILDLFIVNIAFPAIEHDFRGSGLSGLSWVLSGYAIAFAALLIPLGKLGDRAGRRRVFQAGLALFVLGSGVCAAAPSPAVLIAARVLQGVGAAALTPTSLSLVLPLFPLRQRATVIGLWAALGGVGAAMGPPLGGLLVEASWRWIFLVNVPLGLVTIVLVGRRFAEARNPAAPRPDALGTALAVAAVGLATLGLVQGPGWSWDGRVVAILAAAALAAAALVSRSRRHPAPVLDLELFRAPQFTLAALSTFVFFAAFGAFLLGGVLYLTDVWHYSILKAGFGFAPGPLTAAVCAAISGRIAERTGPAAIGAPGGVLFAVGAWLFTHLPAHPSYAASYLPGMLTGGVGVGLILPSFTASAVMAVPRLKLTAGIATETTFRQVGAALGVAVFVAVFGTPVAAQVPAAFDRAFWFMAGGSLAAGLLLLGLAALRTGAVPAPAPAVGDPPPS